MTKEEFIENNLINFRVLDGWKKIISDMLNEIYDIGWNTSDVSIGGKKKHGELLIYFSSLPIDIILRKNIYNIQNKYNELSIKTCEICGNIAKKRYGDNCFNEYYTYCIDHFIKRYTNLKIENHLMNWRGENFDILNITRVESDNILYDITLFSETLVEIKEHSFFKIIFNSITFSNNVKLLKKEKRIAHISNIEQNYYLLLKKIPLSCLNYSQTKIISDFKNSLKPCEICGYIAVFDNFCRYCNNIQWEKCSKDNYENKSEFIKEQQMDLFIDEDDKMKLRQYDHSFEKGFEPKRLFTDNELELYIEELRVIEE